jgi:hypothetical protein
MTCMWVDLSDRGELARRSEWRPWWRCRLGSSPGGMKARPEVYPAENDPKVEALVQEIIARVADKWTMLVLEVLEEHGVVRFTRLGELVGGCEPEDADQDGEADGERWAGDADSASGDSAAGGVSVDGAWSLGRRLAECGFGRRRMGRRLSGRGLRSRRMRSGGGILSRDCSG